MPDLLPALIIEYVAGVIEYAIVAAIAASWGWTIVWIWRHAPPYLRATTTDASGRIVLELLPQHLSIAGLVLAALAIGSGFQEVAALLVAALAAFIFAWVIGWTPRSAHALVGGDALMWTGIATLLGAVFGYAARAGALAQLAVLVATIAAMRASRINERAHRTEAVRQRENLADD